MYDSGRFVEVLKMRLYKINYKDAVIYELPYQHLYQIAPGRELQDSLKYRYFIFGEHDKYGYTIMSTKDKFNTKQDVDSLLTSSAYNTLDIDKFFGVVTALKPERISNHQFVIRGKSNEVGYDSMYFYYDDRLKDLNYELSRKLDVASKSKLFKVELIPPKEAILYNGYIYRSGIISFEIDKVKIDNEAEIETLYQRFRNEVK